MATTNIDAVAEFKVLTNAYQAEYGRAVGAQLQVVTKSGSRDFHGSGYWYGRRSDWNANSWINKRNTPETPKAETQAQRLGLHRRRSDLRARLQRGQEEAVLLLQPGAPAPGGEQRHPRDPRPDRPRAPRRLLAERWTTTAGCSTPSATTSRACRARRPIRAAASRTAACSAASRPTASTRPASRPSASSRRRTSPASPPTSTTRARRRTTRRAVKTCSAWTTRRRTTGASPAAT